MLSVLIPTYGYAALDLARALHPQLSASGVPFELICMDNGSGSPANKINQAINTLEHCRFTALEEDGGRSKIRNRLAAEARYPWLLFLDADVLPVHGDFIGRYVEIARIGHEIAFGGLEYQKEGPDKESMLRWVYGKEREAISLKRRQQDPVRTFTSANFLVSKKLLEAYPFDESLVEYGFEDALLAIALHREGIEVHHLDNPVYHLGLDTSLVFLEKTKNAVQNLWFLHQRGHVAKDDSDLLQWATKIDKMGFRAIVAGLFKSFRPYLEKNLTSNQPSMLLYDLYRLGYLSDLIGA